MINACGQPIKITGRFLRIARLGGEKFRFLEDDPNRLVAALRSRKERIDLFTFIEDATHRVPRFAYRVEWDNLAVLHVTTFDRWWNEQIGFKARNKSKQAAKHGVILRETPFNDDLARGIYEIFNETPVRQGRKFPHYGKDYDSVYREISTHPDDSVFVGAYFEGRLIGFIRLLLSHDRSHAGLLNIVSLIAHRDKSTTNALVAHAVRYCSEHGISYLTYANFAYGRRHRDSLSDFKERNAFQRIEVPRYYVPLTAWGWVCLKMRLHKSLLDSIPEPLIERYRQLRSNWYARQARLSPLGKSCNT